jgi:phage terminase large subunit-like protein
MVEQTIRTVDKKVSLKLVHASKGKITRAEPISALFEQSRAHLVGGFDVLEDQLCTYAAGSSDSPDRLDAMVWGLTELIVTPAFVDEVPFVAPFYSGQRSEFHDFTNTQRFS